MCNIFIREEITLENLSQSKDRGLHGINELITPLTLIKEKNSILMPCELCHEEVHSPAELQSAGELLKMLSYDYVSPAQNKYDYEFSIKAACQKVKGRI